MEIFPIAHVRTRLESQAGGWEVVHESPNLEVGVLVRVAPTPDPPVRHTADEVYVVLAGEATLEAEGESHRLTPGAPLRRLRPHFRPGRIHAARLDTWRPD
jgi:mannose-6-phosphate isomerase-like protein (cupin superfamily)